jgi:hypothetical protein
MKRSFVTLGSWLVLSLLAGSPLPAAQSDPDEVGAWVPTFVEIKGGGAIAKSWERQLREIEALIKANPVFNDLRGYYPELLLKAAPPVSGRGPWLGYVAFEAWWPKAIEKTPGGTPKIKSNWEFNRPPGLWIGINTPRDLSHWTWWEDKAGRFYLLPEARREIAGFPVVGDRMFIIAPGKPPLFDPLPLERALRWVIADLNRQAKADEGGMAAARRSYEQFLSPAGQEKRKREIEAAAASQKKPENQAMERRHAEAIDRRREQDLEKAATPKPGSPQAQTADRLAALEAWLAGLSAAEKTTPAWLKTEPKVRGAAGEIVPPDTPGARPLVVLSAFLDPKLPADALQLVTVVLDPFEDQVKAGSTAPQARIPLAVAEETDWRAVRKLLR